MAYDEILIEDLKAGDETAFRQLFDEYYQALSLFAVNYLKDDSLAADVAQECFIKYWIKRKDFDHLYKVRSFLYTATKNECLNILRNDKRPNKQMEMMSGELFFRNTLIEEEALRMFYQAVDRLPQQSRRVILFALDGYKNEHIASEMDISINTVHMLKKIAYKKLKVMLHEYYYFILLLLDYL